MEIWKNVIDFEGMYQVSNLGNVKSLNRLVIQSNGKEIYLKERILKKCYDAFGYACYQLSKNGKLKNYRGHVLVAMHFLNHKPNGFKLVVDHINNIPSDNRVENLRLLTSHENTYRGRLNLTSKYKGVCWHKGRKMWMSYKNKKHIGYFNTEKEAYNSVLNYEK